MNDRVFSPRSRWPACGLVDIRIPPADVRCDEYPTPGAVDPAANQVPVGGRRATPTWSAIWSGPNRSFLRRCTIRRTTGPGVARGGRWGRLERSAVSGRALGAVAVGVQFPSTAPGVHDRSAVSADETLRDRRGGPAPAGPLVLERPLTLTAEDGRSGIGAPARPVRARPRGHRRRRHGVRIVRALQRGGACGRSVGRTSRLDRVHRGGHGVDRMPRR